ncbi:uncharacterized protein LOC107303508 [Oryza brachyantha]|uniref:uncharacterized protein LOC107303508 n=1 Tax=Oryza brachyantha TaxID=4533 RepID=UPI0007760957|nr:uncharacterized protein LOC107303508 [Oryza brachyantha]
MGFIELLMGSIPEIRRAETPFMDRDFRFLPFPVGGVLSCSSVSWFVGVYGMTEFLAYVVPVPDVMDEEKRARKGDISPAGSPRKSPRLGRPAAPTVAGSGGGGAAPHEGANPYEDLNDPNGAFIAGEEPHPQEFLDAAEEEEAVMPLQALLGEVAMNADGGPHWDELDNRAEHREEKEKVTVSAAKTQQEDRLFSYFWKCELQGKGEMPCTQCFEEKRSTPRCFRKGSMMNHYFDCHRQLMRVKTRVRCSCCGNFFKNPQEYYRHNKQIHDN